MALLRRRPFDASAPAMRARLLTHQTLEKARRAQRELLVLLPVTVAVVLVNLYRHTLFGEELDTPVRLATVVAMVVLGWALARDVGRWVAPWLFRRVDPSTAGTLGFLLRLTFLIAAVLWALKIAGVRPETLAVGGAITAVIFGLAAQQTLGNLIAGLVLLSARPFRVGDQVRLHSGGIAGQLEGRVASLGLLYTTFSQGQDSIMVPNSIVLSSAVIPLREPSSVDLRARLRPGVRPSQIQSLLDDAIHTPVRKEPHIGLEEVDSDELIVRIAATPAVDSDGPRLADEILSALEPITREPQDGDAPASDRSRGGRFGSEKDISTRPAQSGDGIPDGGIGADAA
jgi:small conductance mechanosensitive channel